MARYKVTIEVDDKTVRERYDYSADTQEAVKNAFACLDEDGIYLKDIEEDKNVRERLIDFLKQEDYELTNSGEEANGSYPYFMEEFMNTGITVRLLSDLKLVKKQD